MSQAAPAPSDPFDSAVGLFTTPAAELLIDFTEVRLGDRVLDVGAGTGALAVRAGELAGETGEVVGIDSDPRRLEAARHKAAAAGMEHVSFEEGDARTIRFHTGSFDVVLCGFTLMFIPQKGDVLLRFHDLLRMHGRVGISTWASPELSELWRQVLLPAEMEMEETDLERSRLPYSLSDPDELTDMLVGAGFADIDVRTVEVDAVFESPETLWTALVGPETTRGAQLTRRNPTGWQRARMRSLTNLLELGSWPRAIHTTAILTRGERAT